MNWEQNRYGYVSEVDWLDIGWNVERPNDPIADLFSDRRTDNLMAEWETVAAQYQISQMAMYHAFDTEAQQISRIPITVHNIEKGLIKAKLNQSERLRALESRGVKEIDRLYRSVMSDGVVLADSVITRTYAAKNELMASGQVTIHENNLNLTVDYGVPAAQTAFTLDLATTADLDAQLQAIVDAAKDVGVTITGMMTRSKNISKMRRNAGLQTNINGNVGAGALIRSSALRDYLSEEYGINRIITNDQTYRIPDGIDESGEIKWKMIDYFPSDKVTFFATNASGRMGVGLWGDPPELALRGRGAIVNASGESPYVFVTQYEENDPAVLWTKASALFVPVLFNPNSLFISTTTDSLETEGA